MNAQKAFFKECRKDKCIIFYSNGIKFILFSEMPTEANKKCTILKTIWITFLVLLKYLDCFSLFFSELNFCSSCVILFAFAPLSHTFPNWLCCFYSSWLRLHDVSHHWAEKKVCKRSVTCYLSLFTQVMLTSAQ